jgi:hypothetical protein
MSDPSIENRPVDDPATAPPSPPAVGRRGLFSKWLAVVLVVLFVGGVAIGRWVLGDDSPSAATGQRSPGTTTPTLSTDPSASVLPGLVLRPSDVVSPVTVQLQLGGNQIGTRDSRTATLNLCNGTFPSETKRTARLQVDALDQTNNSLLSSEVVLYVNTAATAQAFSELKSVAAHCPDAPVVSPIGDATVTTHLKAAPDADWPQTPTVDRLAYSSTLTGQSGQTQSSVVVYLRRGRAFMGIYFYVPESTLPSVGGHSGLAAIVKLLADRMAQLPASVVDAS